MHFLPEKSRSTSWFECLPVYVLHHVIVLLAMLVGGLATAADLPRTSALESVYEHAGMHVHLSSVYSTVIDEAQLAWRQCENAQIRSVMQSMLSENLSIEDLRQGFLEQLDQRISDEHLQQIISWIQSDAGNKIYQAERESGELTESSFDSLLESYKRSEIHSDERNARLNQALADTGAVYFLSALNTELSALVSIASVCVNTEKALLTVQEQINDDRSSEALYRSFMRKELLIPSAVVYRNVSDAQLDALSAFGKSDAGNTYYTALIQGMRSLLASKVDRLSTTLETMRGDVD